MYNTLDNSALNTINYIHSFNIKRSKFKGDNNVE